jgi:hypothetical protein
MRYVKPVLHVLVILVVLSKRPLLPSHKGFQDFPSNDSIGASVLMNFEDSSRPVSPGCHLPIRRILRLDRESRTLRRPFSIPKFGGNTCRPLPVPTTNGRGTSVPSGWPLHPPATTPAPPVQTKRWIESLMNRGLVVAPCLELGFCCCRFFKLIPSRLQSVGCRTQQIQ